MRSIGSILAGGIIIILCGGLIMLGDMKVRPAAARAQSLNTLRQIGLALNSYHEVHGHFPAAAIRDKDGQPLLSWRVALLPFLEADDLYREFRQDEKWDSPHNSQLLNRMPGAFRSPRNGPNDPGATYYQVFTGDGAVFENPTGLTRDEIGNGRGLENTLLVVEAADAVPWTRPIDLVHTSGQPLPRLGGRFYGESGLGGVYYLCAVFADSSARYFTEEDEGTIRELISWKR
jgi:hypothetical protein